MPNPAGVAQKRGLTSLQGTLRGVQTSILQQERQEVPRQPQAQRKNPASSPALPKPSLGPVHEDSEMFPTLLCACSDNSVGGDPAPPSQKERKV